MKKLMLAGAAAVALLIPTTMNADARWINGVWYPNHTFSAVIPAPAPVVVEPVDPYAAVPVVTPPYLGYPHYWHHHHYYRRPWW